MAISQDQQTITALEERLRKLETDSRVHEAVCAERYKAISNDLAVMRENNAEGIKDIKASLNTLTRIALWFLGALATAAVAGNPFIENLISRWVGLSH